MRRILKIYDLLKFEDLEKIVTLLPEIKELFEQVDPEYYEFIDNDKKFNFTLHKFPIYTKDEIEELKKTSPKLYQMLLAY